MRKLSQFSDRSGDVLHDDSEHDTAEKSAQNADSL